jgi:hypothetical protein
MKNEPFTFPSMSSYPASKDDLRASTREIIDHFTKIQTDQNTWIRDEFEKVHVELESIKQLRSIVSSLVRELKVHGITLDESKIFSG